MRYERKTATVDGLPVVIWTATLEANVDTDGLVDYIKRDDKDKVTIVRQNNSLQDAIAKNDAQFEDLKEQYKRATTQAERDRIRKQLNDTDRDFLANEKFEEGNVLYYAKDYYGAIKLYREALQLKPNYVEAYNNRGNAYSSLGQKERAIQDCDQAIALNPNFAEAYTNRAEAYTNRGNAYDNLGQYERAIADYDKAIELNPKYAEAYNNRGIAYALMGNFKQAIADATKAIELNPNYTNAYQLRGICYRELGNMKKARADFAKAKALGYKG